MAARRSNPVSAAALLTQPIHQQNQFGGSVGGPFIKDKLFYFLTYDGFRRVGRALYYNTNTITAHAHWAEFRQAPSFRRPSARRRSRRRSAMRASSSSSTWVKQRLRASPSRTSSSRALTTTSTTRTTRLLTSTGPTSVQPTDTAPHRQFPAGSYSANGPAYYHERFLVGGLTTTFNSRM